MLSRLSLAVPAVLLLMGGVAGAQAPFEDTSMATLSAQADLVFQGTVTDITYASSIEGIPHTFVTYSVEDVLKGSFREPTLTLRFIGGVKVEGQVIRRLTVSHAPRFEMGQQDLLMVQGNNEAQCPLVRCAQGRFHLADGFVATEDGRLLGQDAQSRIRWLPGTRQSLAPDEDGAPPPTEHVALATPFHPQEFVAHVRQLLGQQRRVVAPSKMIQSADPSQPFAGPPELVAKPPSERRARPGVAPSPEPSGALSPKTEHDRWEEEALRRNNGNPVLPDSLR